MDPGQHFANLTNFGASQDSFFQWQILRGFVMAFSSTAVSQITNDLFEFRPHLRAAYFILHEPQLCPLKVHTGKS